MLRYSTLFEDGVRSQRLAILAWEQITSLPYVDSDRLGAFGFCFGGAMAMQAARAGANWKVAAGLHAEYPPMTDVKNCYCQIVKQTTNVAHSDHKRYKHICYIFQGALS